MSYDQINDKELQELETVEASEIAQLFQNMLETTNIVNSEVY